MMRRLNPAPRHVALWLLAGAAMIYAMVVIGGITRLTESGLSIVEWQPLRGALPPFTDADWRAEFQKYQRTPQYRQINQGMSLADFKSIFWWEFIHRFWGRLIGLVFAVPMLIFWWRGAFDGGLKRRLVLLFMLGGAQGVIGWWMVTSGLKDNPLVSPYRLALHLGMALLIYGITLWTALGLLQPRVKRRATAKDKAALFLLAAVSMTILAGAFVAGLDAGKIYNEFPFMGAGLAPTDYWHPAFPVLRNFFENHAAVQFHHRLLAMGSFAAAVGFAGMLWKTPGLRSWALTLIAVFALQVTLGILTLLHQVPVGLGTAHQTGAVLVFSVVLLILHRLRRGNPPRKQGEASRFF